MANLVTKKQKTPRGYDVQGARFLEFADGVQPPLSSIPAPYLPVVEKEDLMESWFVVRAGTIVSLDTTVFNSEAFANRVNLKWLVKANGGAAQSVVYAADDVGEVVDIDAYDAGNVDEVTAAKTATKQIAANYPAGVAAYNYWTTAAELIYRNFKLQNTVGFLTRGVIEVPLEFDTGATSVTQATVDRGLIVKPGAKGEFVKWTNGTDSVEQICGRCIRVDPIAAVDALDKVLTVPGFRLPGTGTSGRQLHEDVKLSGTSTLVSRKAKIQLLLL